MKSVGTGQQPQQMESASSMPPPEDATVAQIHQTMSIEDGSNRSQPSGSNAQRPVRGTIFAGIIQTLPVTVRGNYSSKESQTILITRGNGQLRLSR